MTIPPSRKMTVAIACAEGEWPHDDWPGGDDLVSRVHHLTPPYRQLRSGLGDVVDVMVLRCQNPMAELPPLLRAMGAKGAPVLIISPDRSTEQIVTAFRHGVTSYLVEGDYIPCMLTLLVIGTAVGHTHLSPAASVSLTQGAMRLAPGDGGEAKRLRAVLSPRERQIMELLAGGFGAVEIGERLNLSEKTVRNNLSRIYVKLRARSSTDAVRLWLGHTPGGMEDRPTHIRSA